MDLSPIRRLISRALDEDAELSALLIRFTWHCCGTYDKNKGNGGSNGGTMRFMSERADPENAGFEKAYALFEKIKDEEPLARELSYADLYVLGGYVAIEWTGGPKIEFCTGRVDYSTNEASEIYGTNGCPFGDGTINPHKSRLPHPDFGPNEEENEDVTIREKKTIDAVRITFDRMGFTDKETVALIVLGHQFGRCHLEVSGYDGFWFLPAPYDWNNVKYTTDGGYLGIYKQLHLFSEEVTEKGKRQFSFNHRAGKFMLLISDMVLLWDPEYKKHLDFYIMNRFSYWRDAIAVWKKLTELGCHDLQPESR